MNDKSNPDLAAIEMDVGKLLAAEHILILGTVALGGGAMVHGMHFVSEGVNVYASSLRGTRKLLNIAKNSRVSYAVWKLPGFTERHEARSLQMQAVAEVVSDPVKIKELAALMAEKEPWTVGSPLVRLNRWLHFRPVEALWQQGAEEIEARRILRFSAEGRLAEAIIYPTFLKEIYSPMAEGVSSD